MNQRTATVVNKHRTSLTDEELLGLLLSSYVAEFGLPPPRKRLAVLWSVLALEHGAGAAPAPDGARACWNLWCWNFGNRRGVEGDAGVYFTSADENKGGKNVPVFGRWPAFSSAEAGMRTWLRMMATKFRLAWVASLTGNALAYSTAAKLGGYFTAPVNSYASGVRSWMRSFVKRWPPTTGAG